MQLPVLHESVHWLAYSQQIHNNLEVQTMQQETWAGERLAALYRSLQTSAAGLSHADARDRVSRYGSNELVFHHTRSIFLMLLDEFRALFPVLLMVAGGLAFVADYLSAGEGYNLIGMALLGVVVLNALVSFFQNY